jgi:phospholipid/cholesterol/gamma-HCH transport system substrate-binding protein
MFRVATLILVAILILSVLFYLLTGGTLFQQKASLYLYIPDATGLGSGSPVRVDGINVGTVRSIELSGSNNPSRIVRVSISVDQANLRGIPEDSHAQLSAYTLVGDQFVDITSGRSSIPIGPNGEIRYQVSPSLTNLDLVEFEQELRSLDATLAQIQNGTSPLGQFVTGEQLYDDLLKRVTQFEHGLAEVSRTTGQVGSVLLTDTLYRQITGPIERLDQTLSTMESGQGAIGKLLRDEAQYQALENNVAALRRSVASIRAGKLVASDEMYRSLDAGIAKMIQAVDDFSANSLFRTTEMYDNWNGLSQELRDTARDFRTNPEKYLRFQIF